MALTIYGSPRSRTMRVLWMAAELDLEYDHVPYEFDDPAIKQPDFLKLNVAGAIPTIVDDGHPVSESLAINLYLAKKYGKGRLYPADPADESEVWRWNLFAQGHLEPWVQKDALLADLIETIGDRGNAMIDQSLQVLNKALAGRSWLVGDQFSVADLNVAGVLSPSRSRALDLDRFVRLSTWLARCYARPAAVATRRRYSS